MKRIIFALFAVLFVAGCGTPTRAVIKPDVSEATKPGEEACEKPGEWLIRYGRWTCAQPQRIVVPATSAAPGYGYQPQPLDVIAAKQAAAAAYGSAYSYPAYPMAPYYGPPASSFFYFSYSSGRHRWW